MGVPIQHKKYNIHYNANPNDEFPARFTCFDADVELGIRNARK